MSKPQIQFTVPGHDFAVAIRPHREDDSLVMVKARQPAHLTAFLDAIKALPKSEMKQGGQYFMVCADRNQVADAFPKLVNEIMLTKTAPVLQLVATVDAGEEDEAEMEDEF